MGLVTWFDSAAIWWLLVAEIIAWPWLLDITETPKERENQTCYFSTPNNCCRIISRNSAPKVHYNLNLNMKLLEVQSNISIPVSKKIISRCNEVHEEKSYIKVCTCTIYSFSQKWVYHSHVCQYSLTSFHVTLKNNVTPKKVCSSVAVGLKPPNTCSRSRPYTAPNHSMT